jgi:hypothetical protein
MTAAIKKSAGLLVWKLSLKTKQLVPPELTS